MIFTLHPHFSTKIEVIDLPLCRVLLENERHYPWLMLVPRRPSVSRMMDLEKEDRLQLTEEIDLAQKILWELFQPTQLNVAAIGNKTPQLHVHVIARYESDPAWPSTVWDHPLRAHYSEEESSTRLATLQKAFQQLFCC
ncbi:MAG: HIT domain-containing protein [Rhabdochlamydiaceae bacterium]|nr:HIT domain-containing protein [Rhabdochlamydiaceae bacterium]